MPAVIDIYNRALQKLGATRLTSISDTSRNALACNACYDTLRRSELEKNSWNFSIRRFQLAASATAPIFGRSNSFPLPPNFIKLLKPDPEFNFNTLDWEVENGMIMTDFDGPLNVRCVVDVTDVNSMSPLFVEGLATKMAFEMCEEITQSNTKKAALLTDYKETMSEARKSNAFQNVAGQLPDDEYLTARF
jgi:hypothetical protein